VMWVLEKRRNPVINLVQRSYAASLMAILARNARNAMRGSSVAELSNYRADDGRWQTVDRSLTAMNRLCREAGVPFILFHIWEVPEVRALLSGVGGREGFPVLEIFQSGDPRYARQDPRRLVNSPMDSHPNVPGNVMWAELLEKPLRAHLAPWRN